MKFNLIVAMCRNNGIGYKGKMPWHIKEDLHYFSKLTKGDGTNAVIMGNKTWTSLTIPDRIGLPGRDNFVFSKTNRFDIVCEGDRLIKSFQSYRQCIEYIEANPIYKEVWIIGGQQVYEIFLAEDKVDTCYITYIDKEFTCDTFFPALDTSCWKERERNQKYDNFYQCNVDYIVYDHIHRDTYTS